MSQASEHFLCKTTLERICGISVIECYPMKDYLYLHVSYVAFILIWKHVFLLLFSEVLVTF